MEEKEIEEYEIFGEQWKKEVLKLPKLRIIEMAATLGKERDRLQEILNSLTSNK